MFLLKTVEYDAFFFMAKMLFKKTRSQIQPLISESNLLTSEFEHAFEFVGRQISVFSSFTNINGNCLPYCQLMLLRYTS